VFLVGHIVAMVTYCVTKIIPTYSPVIGQFSDTMVVASIDTESGNYDPSKSTFWKVLETVLSHLNTVSHNVILSFSKSFHNLLEKVIICFFL